MGGRGSTASLLPFARALYPAPMPRFSKNKMPPNWTMSGLFNIVEVDHSPKGATPEGRPCPSSRFVLVSPRIYTVVYIIYILALSMVFWKPAVSLRQLARRRRPSAIPTCRKYAVRPQQQSHEGPPLPLHLGHLRARCAHEKVEKINGRWPVRRRGR